MSAAVTEDRKLADRSDLVLTHLVDAAAAKVRAAQASYNQAVAAVQAAEAALETARRAPDLVFQHAVGGHPPTDAAIDELYGAEPRLQHRVAFRQRLADHAAGVLKAAEEDQARARNEAHFRLLCAAAAARIEAAAAAEVSAPSPGRAGDPQKFAAAQVAWERANEMLRRVQAGCTLLRGFAIQARVHESAAQERQFWRARQVPSHPA